MSDLQTLLSVQDLDTQLDRLTHELDNLPQRREVDEVIRTATDVKRRFEGAIAAHRDVAQQQAGVDEELGLVERRIKSIDARLYGNEQIGADDARAMTHELETLNVRKSNLE